MKRRKMTCGEERKNNVIITGIGGIRGNIESGVEE
jgi:hypothetical protein